MVIRRPIHYVYQRVKVVLDEKVKNISGSDNPVTNPRFGPTDAEKIKSFTNTLNLATPTTNYN